MKPIPLFWSQPARLPVLVKNQSPAEKDVLPYTQSQLFQRAIINLPRIAKPMCDVPLWVLVKELFNCGEDVAHRICWRYGFNPDGVCHKPTHDSRLPWEDLDDGK